MNRSGVTYNVFHSALSETSLSCQYVQLEPGNIFIWIYESLHGSQFYSTQKNIHSLPTLLRLMAYWQQSSFGTLCLFQQYLQYLPSGRLLFWNILCLNIDE